jgi:hypothetical protein
VYDIKIERNYTNRIRVSIYVFYSILRYLFVAYFALFIRVHPTVVETKRKSDIESKIQHVPFRTSSAPCTLGCLYALLSINHDGSTAVMKPQNRMKMHNPT